ncbi:MAG: hypothetical protein U0Z26_09615 [Anaerolineales bacterium]
MQNKTVIAGKTQKHSRKKHTIQKHHPNEKEITVEVEEDGDYEFEKLSIEGLPEKMIDGNPIRWINNFAIKKNGNYINQRFFVTIPNPGASRVIIYDGNGNPYYYTGEIKNNVFELTDGDPAVGFHP